MTVIKAKIRKIGNSKGILFPKDILEKTGITSDVKITVKDKTISIEASRPADKKKWSDFKKKKTEKADFVHNTFDDTDWTW